MSDLVDPLAVSEFVKLSGCVDVSAVSAKSVAVCLGDKGNYSNTGATVCELEPSLRTVEVSILEAPADRTCYASDLTYGWAECRHSLGSDSPNPSSENVSGGGGAVSPWTDL